MHDRFHEINFHNSKSEYHDSVGIMQSVDSGYLEGTRSYSDIKTFDNVQTQPHIMAMLKATVISEMWMEKKDPGLTNLIG